MTTWVFPTTLQHPPSPQHTARAPPPPFLAPVPRPLCRRVAVQFALATAGKSWQATLCSPARPLSPCDKSLSCPGSPPPPTCPPRIARRHAPCSRPPATRLAPQSQHLALCLSLHGLPSRNGLDRGQRLWWKPLSQLRVWRRQLPSDAPRLPRRPAASAAIVCCPYQPSVAATASCC